MHPEGLDVTINRLCNPWLAVLLDAKGQITSIRFQGQERLCGFGNRALGYVLNTASWLRTDLRDADIEVASDGPVRGVVIARQRLQKNIELVRRIHINLFNPLLECVTEFNFDAPTTLAGDFVVGEFDIIGKQVIWPLPLQAGNISYPTRAAPAIILSAQDTIDVQTDWQGLRYMAHRTSTPTYQYAARPVDGGIRLGLIASTPTRAPDPAHLGARSGLGFPGHTYHGRYVYRYALQPLSPDAGVRTAFYNSPLLWSFYPKHP